MNFIRNLTIRTRLLIMLLFASLLACAVLGYLGSNYGQFIINKEVTNQLSLVRNAKKSQIESYLGNIANFVEIMGQNKTVIQATREFKAAFRELNNEKLNAECSDQLSSHYKLFMDRLAGNVEIKSDLDLFYPRSVEACYLQFEYIVDNPNPIGKKDKLLDAGDGSSYSDVHRKYHEYFNLQIKKFNFYDVFLVDLERGDIVYTAYKETDFATNLYTGPYRTSNLADLARTLRVNGDVAAATWIDFASYRPSYGAPAGFLGVPLSENGEVVGALIFQLPVDEINAIMTGDQNWQTAGLGDSGEVYLVGEDFMMRSISRFFLEDTTGYTNALLNRGMSEEDVAKMYRFGTTILQQRVRSETAAAALEGKDGVKLIKDYRGVEVLSAYAPLQLNGFNWVILSEMDAEEAFRPVSEFNRRMFIQTIIIILVVTLLSMFMAGRFVRPFDKLSMGAEKIMAGDMDHRVNIESKDEFGVLATSFNQMVSKMSAQQTEIQEKSDYNEQLILNFIPKKFAQRLERGEQAFAENYQNLSLIAIDLVGFSQLTGKIGADKSLQLLNEIVGAFDNSATRNYVEKIRTVGDTYFAACGLFEPRLDHARRIIQFAKEARQLIDQFNLNHKIDLQVQLSINSGEIVAGLVGKEKFNFDVWGETVSELFRMNELEQIDEILVSKHVAEHLEDFFVFRDLDLSTRTGLQVFALDSAKPN